MPNIDVSDEALSALKGLARSQGIDLGMAPNGSDIEDEKPTMPAVDLTRAVSDVAHETGLNLKATEHFDPGLYLFQERLVTIDPDGSPREMDADRFRTWIDQWQLNFSKRRKEQSGDEVSLGPPIKATMRADVARVLLASDEFRCHIREIKRILPVRLPVFQELEDVRSMRMLDYGFDAESGVFTVATGVDYSLEWSLEQAVEYLRDLFKDYPFADDGRSVAVQLSAMLTLYCQCMFEEFDAFPMMYYNAQGPGSGKSILAQIPIYAIYGVAESLDYGENDEFKKALDTWAQNGLAYTFFDDVGGLVKNNNLNRWITMPTWSGRVMHSQRMFSVRNQTMTLLTGNQATLSDDLGRRSMIIDLFTGELPEERMKRMSKVIDEGFLALTSTRCDILSAMHALVSNWIREHEAKPYGKKLPSFRAWSSLIPAIVTAAGFDCPLKRAEISDAGQKQEIEFQRMLEQAIREHKPTLEKPVDLRLNKWAAMARTAGVFHSLLSDKETMREFLDTKPMLYKPVLDEDGCPREMSARDKDEQALEFLDRSMSTKFANMLHKHYRGAIRTIDGARYKFADRESRHSTFAIEMIKDAE